MAFTSFTRSQKKSHNMLRTSLTQFVSIASGFGIFALIIYILAPPPTFSDGPNVLLLGFGGIVFYAAVTVLFLRIGELATSRNRETKDPPPALTDSDGTDSDGIEEQKASKGVTANGP